MRDGDGTGTATGTVAGQPQPPLAGPARPAAAQGPPRPRFGATVLPFKNDTLGFYSEENESKRARLNKWIRTGGEYDGVVDFDRAMRDPGDPLALDPAYDSGDHLHPNDAGMAVMAGAVPLAYFR